MQNYLLETLLVLLTAILSWDSIKQRKRYKLLCDQTRNENKLKEFELAKQYVDEFSHNIINPLKHEISRLTHAINATKTCPHYPDCPVDAELRHCPTPPCQPADKPDQQQPDQQPADQPDYPAE